MKKVVETIQKEPKLVHLLKTFTNRQLADRVRLERKAMVRANEKKKLKKRGRKSSKKLQKSEQSL